MYQPKKTDNVTIPQKEAYNGNNNPNLYALNSACVGNTTEIQYYNDIIYNWKSQGIHLMKYFQDLYTEKLENMIKN